MELSFHPALKERLIAFLRAINVGGHVVTMNTLRREFEALGFTEVETFIANYRMSDDRLMAAAVG